MLRVKRVLVSQEPPWLTELLFAFVVPPPEPNASARRWISLRDQRLRE